MNGSGGLYYRPHPLFNGGTRSGGSIVRDEMARIEGKLRRAELVITIAAIVLVVVAYVVSKLMEN